jgi:hypothetical protein
MRHFKLNKYFYNNSFEQGNGYMQRVNFVKYQQSFLNRLCLLKSMEILTSVKHWNNTFQPIIKNLISLLKLMDVCYHEGRTNLCCVVPGTTQDRFDLLGLLSAK